jgi:hypothetical protein
MTLRRIAIAVGFVALVVPAAAGAQGLGDAATREKARREAAKDEAAKKAGDKRVFTNEDLNEGRTGTPGAEPSAGAAPASESAPLATDGGRQEPAAPPEPDRPDEETERRSREQAYVDAVAAAHSGIAGIEARIKELQARLNPMSTTFVYGEFNGVGTDKVAQEAEVKAELAQAQAELDSARQTLASATRALQEFRQGGGLAPAEPR